MIDDVEDHAVDTVMGPMLRVAQVADLMSVSEWTVRRWMQDGIISFIRVGGTTRFRMADVRGFIERYQNLYGQEEEEEISAR